MIKLDYNIYNFNKQLLTLINKYGDKISPGICLLALQKIEQQLQQQYTANINTYFMQHPAVKNTEEKQQ